MKIKLIMLLLFFGLSEINAQHIYVPGTVAKGKNAAYRCMEEARYFLRVRNIKNTDTTQISYYNDGRIVEEEAIVAMSDTDMKDLYKAFREVLTNEEWNQLKGRRGGLRFDIVADNKGNTVELSFFFIKTDPVMTKIDPDRLFVLEQKLKKIIRLRANDPNIRNIKNFKYISEIIYKELK